MAIRFDQIELANTGHQLYPVLQASNATRLRVQSSDGYVDIGSGTSSSYGYLLTDRANFYVDKPVSFDGNISGYGGNETASFAIYYDRNNTAYYVNPADYSLLNGITMYTAGATDTGSVHLGRGAFITFYGNSNSHHGIGSRDTNGNLTDDLRINSYHNVHINLDSNNNNGTSDTVFTIGHHGQGTGTVANTAFSVTGGGIATATSDMRAPIFYDSDDTTYFLNPGMGQMRLGVTNNFSAIETKGSGGYLSLRVTDGGHSDGWGWSFTDQDVSATSFTTYLRVNYNGTATSSSVVATGSFNAPIFYDKDNTGYYVNPAAGSKLVYLGLATDPNSSGSYRLNMGGSIDMNANNIDYISQLHFNDNVRFYDDGNDNYVNFKYGDTNNGGIKIVNGSGTLKGYLYADAGAFGLLDKDGHWMLLSDGASYTALRANNNEELVVYTDRVEIAADLRSPIYYDLNNTAYYVDPAGHSYLSALLLENARVSGAQEYPPGHYTGGKEIWSLDPTWTDVQIQQYFGSSNVSWSAQSDAPGGWAIYVNGSVNVGASYNSGFPYIPVEAGAIYYMECYIKNAGTGQTHYMGSIERKEDLTSNPATGQGNPGTFGYWTMSNFNPGTSWTKVHGIIRGSDANAVGYFETETKYWTPHALFNYGAGSGTRACYISGWKVVKISDAEYFADGVVGSPSIAFAEDKDTGIFRPGSNQLSLVTGGSKVLSLSDGKVGINTTDPDGQGYSFAEDLVILGGNSASDGVGLTLRGNGKTYGVIAFGDNADDNVGEIYYNHNNDTMSFRAGGGVRLYLSSTIIDGQTNQFKTTNPNGLRIDSASHARIELDATDDWSYVRFMDSGNVSWDLATYDSGNIEFRPGGSGSNRTYFDSSGNSFSEGSKRAPLFYDSNDTGYYLDANSSGTALSIAGLITNNTNQHRVKYSVWSGQTYGIGMKNGFDYGHIGSDSYAMTFQMNDQSDRGFWWGDNGHTDDQGAMSLTTNGKLVVATSISVGEGQSVTSPNAGTLYVSGTGTASTDFRAPIFYDSDDTNYYLNPAASSTSFVTKGDWRVPSGIAWSGEYTGGGKIQHHSNHWYIQSPDAGGVIFRNASAANKFIFDHSSGYGSASGDWRAPIFYDKDDTNYYTNPAGTSIVKYLGRKAHQEGLMVGGYNNIGASHAKTNPIFTIGSSYLPNETTLGNMYGIGYTRGDMSGMPGTSGWGMYVAADGDARIFLDGQNGGVGTASASWRAPIFYDSNDTGYYLDANSSGTALSIAGLITNNTNQHRVKYSVWSGQTYGIGMKNGFDYGHIGSDEYAMTFQMNDQSDRGFWWGDNGHTDDQGAMSLTTNGKLVVATSISVGEGQSVTSPNAGTLYVSGTGTASTDLRAPLFYDSNDTNYYLNPNSTSKLYDLRIERGEFHNNKIDFYSTSTDGYSALRFYYNSTQQNTIHAFGSTWASSAWPSNSAGAINLSGLNGVTIGAWNSPGAWIYNDGEAQFQDSVRSPIFYDSANTSYYVDPASASKLTALKLEPGSGNNVSGDDNVLWIHRVNNNDWGIQINADQGTATDYGYEFLGGSSHTYAFSGVAAGTRYFNVGSSFAQHTGSFRAPTFIDSDNTSYSLTPSSTTTGYWQVNTPSGYVQIGPGNGSYSHFYTDRGKYYFNKELTVDTGIISSYDEDLLLRRLESNTDYIRIRDASIGFFLDTAEDMRLENDGDLHVEGDVIAYSTTVSDKALKDDVITIDSALDKVSKLRGVEYTWNATSRKGQKDIGVIAQEVEEVIPEIVREKKMSLVDGEKYKTVDYEKLTAVLIEAVKELKEEIYELKKQIK